MGYSLPARGRDTSRNCRPEAIVRRTARDNVVVMSNGSQTHFVPRSSRASDGKARATLHQDRPSERASRRRVVLPSRPSRSTGKRLAGLLTCVSSVVGRLPRAFAPVACWSDLRAYSCGAVADSHRASQTPDILFVVRRPERCQRHRDVRLQLKRTFSRFGTHTS